MTGGKEDNIKTKMKKTYEIPFADEKLIVELPEEQVVYVAHPMIPEVPGDVDAMIESALDSPYGSDRLENMVKPGDKVLVLLDDITRPTPKKIILPHVLRRLALAGVDEKNVKLCLAPGTHRLMTEEELPVYIGRDIINRYEIVNISYKDLDRLTYIGDSPSGVPIDVYKEAIEADFIIGVGNIVPHVSAGWGGGAKIVQPGICGERTTRATHIVAALEQNVMETCGNADNKCRREMELIARQVGLKFIVNTVMDENKNVLGVFCGDFIDAHRAGVQMAKKVLSPEIPCKADIVIASANPCEIDFWQGDKPFVFAQYGLKDNGTLIFVIEGREGLCGNASHHEATLRKYCTLSEERIRQDVKDGKIDDVIAIDNPIHLDQVRRRGVNTLVVTRGFSERDCKDLGFEMTGGLNDAVARAFARQGDGATVGIIPYCGETMVRVKTT